MFDTPACRKGPFPVIKEKATAAEIAASKAAAAKEAAEATAEVQKMEQENDKAVEEDGCDDEFACGF